MLKYSLITLIVVTLGFIGNMDYQDEVNDELRYTRMVCDNLYPNYRNLDIDCDKHRGTSTD
jgi:hypothetical protein